MDSLEQNFLSSPSKNNKVWYDDVAEKLLSRNFLLTALEFHAELTESGKELPKLKKFFSNPGNFEQAIAKPEILPSVNLPRSSSQATLDSLDLTRYSEDGERSTDDKVAVLEFELRKARETINALRANLTEAAESETYKCKLQEENLKAAKSNNSKGPLPIKPHEQRALNFLINEYLLLNGYKLTSITFADENESQDFENWDDVGLNCARPLELLYLYREGLKGTGFSYHTETKDFECQVALYDEIQRNLQINELEAQVAELTDKINKMNTEFSTKFISLENQEIREMGFQQSLTPDPENFEIIEAVRNQEGSETKSDKSIGDWTNLIDKNKKENFNLKFSSQSFLESISNDDKIENQSGVFENTENEESIFGHKKTTEQNLEDNKSVNSLKFEIDNFHETGFHEFDDIDEYSFSKKDSCKDILILMDGNRGMPESFKNAVFRHCDMIIPTLSGNDFVHDWIQQMCSEDISTNQLVETLSDCLPKITPNIILNKREEIIPLLILSICLNKNLSVRDKLLNLLFNLKKKPDSKERKVILNALLVIAKLKGTSMVENEILPQCWEQILHKYVERRLLVAESCFLLAPYVSETIRNSLIISIAQQLIQDREESVRRASVNILTILIALISDENKYSQVLHICMQLLNDQFIDEMKYVNQLLFPTLAQWSFTLKKIQSDLYNKLLLKIKTEKNLCVLNVIEILLPFLVMTVVNSEFLLKLSCDSHPPPSKRQEFCNLCKGLCDPALFFQASVSKAMATFDYYTSQPNFESSEWPELQWIEQVFICNLIEAGDSFWEDSTVLKALMSILRFLCLGLGRNVTNYKVKPFLLEKLLDCENSMVSGQDCKYSIIPLYTCGVLSAYPDDHEQEMNSILRRLICALPLCGVSLSFLQVTVEILSQYKSWQTLVLEAIWEGVVHQRPLVRAGSALLLNSVIPNVPDDLLVSKVMPALVTLSSDPETSVRVDAVPGLEMLMSAKEKAIKDKVYLTFQTLLQDSVSSENYTLMIHLIKMITRIYEQCDPRFKDEVIVPQLFAMTALASKTKSKDLVEVLVDAFSAITYSQTQVSFQRIFSAVLPGLRHLEAVCSHSTLFLCSEHVDSMIKEVERRFSGLKESAGKSPTTSSFEAKRNAMAVSTQIAVEDVRNRVTKIFNPRPNTLQNVSGIFRKKL